MRSSLKKYINPKKYAGYFGRRFADLFNGLLPPNMIIDRLISPITFQDLFSLKGPTIKELNLSANRYRDWVQKYFPDFHQTFKNLYHKKLLELYTTFKVLNPQPSDTFMDAAGGEMTHLHWLNCRRKILQDIRISSSVRSRFGAEVEYLEGDAGTIGLPDKSIDKISCHHSFEHFQRDSDILFIKEVQRLLKPKGKCCIIPIFIGNKYLEITDIFTFDRKYDRQSKRLIDPTATIAGRKFSGNYARIYDLESFQERILNKIDLSAFEVLIFELRLDGEVVPDLSLDCHKIVTGINRLYRAMVIKKAC